MIWFIIGFVVVLWALMVWGAPIARAEWKLVWEVPECTQDEFLDDCPDGYNLYYGRGPTTDDLTNTHYIDGKDTTEILLRNIPDLEGSKDWWFGMKSINGAGESDWSPSIEALQDTSFPDTPPDPPINPRIAH